MSVETNYQVEDEGPDLRTVLQMFARQLAGPADSPGMNGLIIVNLYILLCRPQDIIPILGSSKLLLFLSIIPALVVVLPRLQVVWKSSPVVKAMCLFVLLGAAWVPFARNNFWAFHNMRDLAQQFLCYMFPVILLMAFGKRLRLLAGSLAIVGLYLGVYSLTHAGRGPGGFLGDENDLCMQLLMLLGIPLMLIPAEKSFTRKIWFTLIVVVILGGVVATSSRGGFVGLVALLGYLFLKSPHKIPMIFLGVFIGGIAAASVPPKYWNEMSTITDTKEGTADARLQTWKIIYRMWTDPKNFVFGTSHGRSFAGRATHSSLMQLIGDLGLAGLLLFGAVVWYSVIGVNRKIKQMKLLNARIRALNGRIAAAARRSEDEEFQESEFSDWDEEDRAITPEQVYPLLQRASAQGDYLIAFMSGVNTSWMGALGAGLFISTLYYPAYWLLATISVTVQLHVSRLEEQFLFIEREMNAMLPGEA